MSEWPARRMPLLRAQMLERWAGQSDTELRRGEGRAGALLTALRMAELLHVSGDMCQVVAAAAESMPWHRIGREHLPAEQGLLVWDTPPATIDTPELAAQLPLRGCVWTIGHVGGRLGVLAGYCTGAADLSAALVTAGADPGPGWVGTVPPLLVAVYAGIPLGADVEELRRAFDDTTGDLEPASRVLVTTWLLMAQPIAVEATERIDRAGARQLARAGSAPAQPVRVIHLRRATRPRAGETDEPGRLYRHRWVVRGHWRQQWYPSRDQHVPIWITAHIAGPDGAPLLGGNRVYELDR